MKSTFIIRLNKRQYLEVYLWASITRFNREYLHRSKKSKKESVACYTDMGRNTGCIGQLHFYQTDMGTVAHEITHFLIDINSRTKKGKKAETLCQLADYVTTSFWKGYYLYWWKRYIS